MIRVTALTLLLCACGLSQDDFKKRFEALDDKRDHDGVVALWKGAPGRVLGTIDSYLEGALKLMEEGKADDKTIATMHQRALRGALAADQARPNTRRALPDRNGSHRCGRRGRVSSSAKIRPRPRAIGK